MAEAQGKGIVYDEVKNSDVLLGRGKSIHCHPGNIEYRKVVKEKSRQYQTVEDAAAKDAIAHAVISSVLEKGGKFMRHTIDEERWVECPASIVRTKVKQALRDMVKDRKPMSEKPNVPKREIIVKTRRNIARPAASRVDSTRANPAAQETELSAHPRVITDQSLSTGIPESILPHSLEALIPSRSHAVGQNLLSSLSLGRQPQELLGAGGLGSVPNLLRQRSFLAPNLLPPPIAPAVNYLGPLSATQQYLTLLQQAQSLQQQPVVNLDPHRNIDAALADLIQRLRDGQR